MDTDTDPADVPAATLQTAGPDDTAPALEPGAVAFIENVVESQAGLRIAFVSNITTAEITVRYAYNCDDGDDGDSVYSVRVPCAEPHRLMFAARLILGAIETREERLPPRERHRLRLSRVDTIAATIDAIDTELRSLRRRRRSLWDAKQRARRR